MAARARAASLPLRMMRNHLRLVIAAAAGVALLLLLPGDWHTSRRVLLAWDFGVVIYLVLAFAAVAQCDVKHVRQRAEEQDEGALLLLILVVAAAIASLGAIVAELGAQKAAHGGPEKFAFLLAALTAVLSWALIHVIFAFHYAHEFYGAGNAAGGLTFPGDEHPNYWDFVYFSFVIGMTFQVSDVQITSKALRRMVVVHGALSFFFSVAILALTVNIGASLI